MAKSSLLIVTDLNGVLCRKHPKGDGPIPDGWVESKSYRIELRPGAKEFLTYCIEKHNLAIWSSTTYPNSQPMVDALLTAEQKSALIFVWYRDRTRLDPEFGERADIRNYDTVKNLEDVYSHPFFERIWTNRNTVIIDDSQTKTRFNSPNNVFLVPTFVESGIEDVFDALKLRIALQCLHIEEKQDIAK